MITFDKTRMAAIEADFKAQRRQQLAEIFRERYPILAQEKSAEELPVYLGLVVEDAKPLGISENEHLLECAAIGLFAQRPEVANKTVVLIARALNQLTWEPEARLSFIRQHILPANVLG